MKVGKYILDEEQTLCVNSKSKNLLVVAGAGSGKTLTILGKISFLINNNIKPEEILCISFTHASSLSLKEKIKNELNIDVNVYTFHKLALSILNNKYEIALDDCLESVIDELFDYDLNKKNSVLYKYLDIYSKREFKQKYNEIYSLKKLVSKFIHLFKSNNYTMENFIDFHKEIRKITNILNYKKEKLFLILVINTLLNYNKFLEINKCIDFDDMLLLAKNYVDKNGVINNYRYIIIDEFQDTSLARFDLIKSIVNKTGAYVMAVGDDFQSIYRFNGCDLNLFVNFKEYFNNSEILKIQNTYRNSDELIKIAGNFVMKNKYQIKKELHSLKHISNPICIIYYEKNILEKLINKIYDKYKGSIMILGRNNKDINRYLNDNLIIINDKIIYKKNKSIDITFMSVHKSKGLESDNVIVLNVIDDKLGFPNKIIDNRILRLVSNKGDYPYDEERRLFYVALTRTKNKVFLITEKNKESIFIKEIKKEFK